MFLEKEFIFKKNSRSKVELQEVQKPQTPIQDSMEMDKDSQEVVESEPMAQEPRTHDNHVWTLVDAPEGAKIIECKWIFNLKADNTFKGRLVAEDFKQTHGIDYDETFSPVVMLKSIRVLLAIAVGFLMQLITLI